MDWDGSKESAILPGEEVYLDVNLLAKDKSYCSLGAARLSPSQKYLAYAVDYKGKSKPANGTTNVPVRIILSTIPRSFFHCR